MSGPLDARLHVRPADFRLPPGLQLSRGLTGGTPTTRGTFTVTIRVTRLAQHDSRPHVLHHRRL